MELNGASAIVTGGASGIGAATARQLADLGARVVIADMQAERGEALAHDIGGVFVPVDVTKTEQIEDAVNTATAFQEGVGFHRPQSMSGDAGPRTIERRLRAGYGIRTGVKSS